MSLEKEGVLTPEESIDALMDIKIQSLNVTMPATVIDHDISTNRLQVQPAINKVYEDGEVVVHPIISNVPLITIAGGGYCINMKLSKGDVVLLVFAQRCLENFKQSLLQSNPQEAGFFHLKDAIAIPSLDNSLNPINTAGLNIQKKDGSIGIVIEDDKILLKGNIEVQGNIEVSGKVSCESANIGGIEFDQHTHISNGQGSPTDTPE